MRWSRTLTPEAQVAFLAALRGGALVAAAARGAGVALSTLYWRRKKDPLFAMAWESAAQLSAEAPGRRLRFGERRRALFLTAFEGSCNLSDACARTGVDPATVYRHLCSDEGFERDCRGALERGYVRLEKAAAAERAEAARRAAARRERRDAWFEPTGEMTTDFDEIMKLLARYQRADGSVGIRFVRRGRLKMWSFDDAIALLGRRLDNLEPGWGGGRKRTGD